MVDPSQIFPVLNAIIEFSKKSEEIIEDFNELRMTCESIQNVLKGSALTYLSVDFQKTLFSDLSEALKLLQSVKLPDTIAQKFISSIRSLLPGNKIVQIKEMTSKLLRYVQQLNMIMLNAKLIEDPYRHPPTKKPKNCSLNNNEGLTPTLNNELGPTLNSDLGPTLDSNNNNNNEKTIYEIVWNGSSEMISKLAMNPNIKVVEALEVPKIEGLPENKKKEIFSCGRGKFTIFKNPPFGSKEDVNIFNSLSREHITLKVQKSKKVQKNLADEMFFTCNDENKEVAVEESKSSSKKNCEKPANSKNELKNEEKEGEIFELDFFIEDKSLNGTYIQKKNQTSWIRTIKNEDFFVEIGDLIGLVMLKEANNPEDLKFAFGFYINKKIE